MSADPLEAARKQRDLLMETLIADDDVIIGGSGTNLVTGEADVSYTRKSEEEEITYWVTVQPLPADKT